MECWKILGLPMGFSAKSNNTMGTVKTTAHRYLSQRHVCCLGLREGPNVVKSKSSRCFVSYLLSSKASGIAD